MKRYIGFLFLAALWAGLLFFRNAQAASRPNYLIAFVPVNWQGDLAEFENEARRQGDFFVAESGMDYYADVEIVMFHDRLDGVSLDNPWLVEEIVAFGLTRQPADRYIGLTNGDLAPGGSSAVVGWTRGPDSIGMVVEVSGVEVSAHELGHTFSLCDEYLYDYWERQNDEWTCPNPYPADCPQTYGRFCEGAPAPNGSYSIMGPDGLPGEYAFNQPSWDHLQSVFAALFSASGPHPTPVAPPPIAPPTPIPAPITQTLALVNPNLVRIESDGIINELVPAPALHPAWSPNGSWIAYSSARQGTLDLYRIPALGGAPQQLTDFPSRETHPVWLPGNNQLIFASDSDGLSALFILDIPTNTIQPMNGLPRPTSWPAISRDGLHLAFSAAPDGDWDLYMVELDANQQPVLDTLTRLTSAYGSDISPAWNIDGSALSFASSYNGSLDLYLLSVDDISITPLTNSSANEWAAHWLEDGRIVYQTYDGSALGIWVLNPSSGSRTMVAAGWETAAWPAPAP